MQHMCRALVKKAESVNYDTVAFHWNGSKLTVALLKDGGRCQMPVGEASKDGFNYSTVSREERFTWDVLEAATPELR
jgi:hypothetical protein